MTPVKVVASGTALFALVLGLAVASNALLDRYFPGKPAAAAATVENTQMAPTEGACIDASGAKRNWPWANAPTLWPACRDDASPAPARKE